MKILLIQPDYQIEGFGFRLAAMPEPLHLEILAALIPQQEIKILDMRVDADLSATLESFHPDVIGVTALTTEVYAAKNILQTVRRFDRRITTIVGGHHATLCPQDFEIPTVDVIGLGEAEGFFVELIDAIQKDTPISAVDNLIYRQPNGIFTATERVEACFSMDDQPLPRRDLVDHYRNEYFFLFDSPDSSVATSRGCPFKCNFCSVHEFYKGGIRQMSADRVIQEINHVSTKHITFVDDNFLMNAKREMEIANRILADGIDKTFSMESRTDAIARRPDLVEKWVECGLYAVLLGLEGASETALANVNKSNSLSTNDEAIRILQDNGVIIWGAFLVDPMWEEDEFKQLAEYVHSKEITHTQYTVLTPLIGTELYRQRYNDLITHDYSYFDTLHAVTPTKLPREEFYKQFAKLYQQTNLGPYFDLVSEGKLSIDDCRRGKEMLDIMSQWENYAKSDPILNPKS